MVQSVELLLDTELDAAVRQQWTALSAAGLPSQNGHTGSSNRPHITVAVADVMPDAVDRGDAMRFDPFPVRLGGLLVFGGGRATLARTVVPSDDLLELHRQVSEAVGSHTYPHMAPGEWTPHVTLARRLTADQVAAAVEELAPRVVDLVGTAVAVRRWDGTEKREWRIG